MKIYIAFKQSHGAVYATQWAMKGEVEDLIKAQEHSYRETVLDPAYEVYWAFAFPEDWSHDKCRDAAEKNLRNIIKMCRGF
jgi:hypothetical protein